MQQADPIAQTTLARPRSLWIAIGLLAAALGVCVTRAIYATSAYPSDEMVNSAILYAGLMPRVILWGLVILSTAAGWPAARIALLGLFIPDVVETIERLFHFQPEPVDVSLSAARTLIEAAAIATLFGRTSNFWFAFRRMDPRRPLREILTGVALALPLTLCVPLVRPSISRTVGPISPAKATGCPIPLPASARNVQYVHFSLWQAFKEVVRFEAPVEDCKAYVALTWKAARDRFPGYPTTPGQPKPFRVPREDDRSLESQLERYRWTSQGAFYAPWFDLESIRNGIEIEDAAATANIFRPHVWIDLDRGVFYYAITD